MARLPSQNLMTLHNGDWIGDYEILRRLRAGGMATLFLGRRHGAAGFTKLAAIKIVHPHLSYDERFLKMFVDEARICSLISHPNVVHVEAFGEQSGLYYLVMEYVNGASAAQLLRHASKEKKPMPMAIAVQIAIQVANGLHGAHEAVDAAGESLGVIHRDISPSNVLISRDGHVKVIDFGIAKAKGRVAATDTGHSIKGKLKYMAPEQARSADIDRRADIFSLGVVTWELLTGRQLFDADGEMALLARLQNHDIPPPTSINPEIPAALEAAVLKALELDPNDRFPTALEFRRALQSALPEAGDVDASEIGELVAETVKNAPEVKVVEIHKDGTTVNLPADGSGSELDIQVIPTPDSMSQVAIVSSGDIRVSSAGVPSDTSRVTSITSGRNKGLLAAVLGSLVVLVALFAVTRGGKNRESSDQNPAAAGAAAPDTETKAEAADEKPTPIETKADPEMDAGVDVAAAEPDAGEAKKDPATATASREPVAKTGNKRPPPGTGRKPKHPPKKPTTTPVKPPDPVKPKEEPKPPSKKGPKMYNTFDQD